MNRDHQGHAASTETAEPAWLTRLRRHVDAAGGGVRVEVDLEQVRYLLQRWPEREAPPTRPPFYIGERFLDW
mgnify:CR=1 FL=1